MKKITIGLDCINITIDENDLPLFWNALFKYARLPTPKPHEKIGRPTIIDKDIIDIILDNPDVPSRKLAKIIKEKISKEIHSNTIWRYRHDHNLPQPKKGFGVKS